MPASAAEGWWEGCRRCWLATRDTCGDVLASVEAALRSGLRRNLHALVAALLIAGLFVGTTGLATFLSMRVAQEGRATVLAVRDAFPTAWAGMAASTPLLAEAVAGEHGAVSAAAPSGAGEPGGEGSGTATQPPGLPAWVTAYQAEALALVQQSLPALASWAESQFYGALERQNLTSALG